MRRRIIFRGAAIICAAFVLLAAMAAALALPVAAAESGTILIAGDALSSGRGLDDRLAKSYGNLLAAGLGVAGKNLINIAGDSADSESVLETLSLHTGDIKKARLIVISVGADDLIKPVMAAVESLAGGSVTYSKLLELARAGDFAEKLNGAIDYAAMINDTVRLAAKLDDIMRLIKSNNSDAEIVLLMTYNPVDGIAELEGISSIFERAADTVNNEIKKAAEEYGTHALDLSEAFAGAAKQLTNITSFDIAPSASGHVVIAELLEEYVRSLPALPVDTTPPDTDEDTTGQQTTEESREEETTQGKPLVSGPTEDDSHLWTYIVFTAVAAAGGIAVGAAAVVGGAKRNKKQ